MCDFDQERLDYIQQLYRNVKTTTDFAVVLKDPDIDAIIVATPVRYHYKLALASLKAVKHVFIEKPMASTSAQCWELNELAKVKKLTLLVGHTFVYTSAV